MFTKYLLLTDFIILSLCPPPQSFIFYEMCQRCYISFTFMCSEITPALSFFVRIYFTTKLFNRFLLFSFWKSIPYPPFTNILMGLWLLLSFSSNWCAIVENQADLFFLKYFLLRNWFFITFLKENVCSVINGFILLRKLILVDQRKCIFKGFLWKKNIQHDLFFPLLHYLGGEVGGKSV